MVIKLKPQSSKAAKQALQEETTKSKATFNQTAKPGKHIA